MSKKVKIVIGVIVGVVTIGLISNIGSLQTELKEQKVGYVTMIVVNKY